MGVDMENWSSVLSEDRLFDERVIELIEGVHNIKVDRDSIRRRTRLRGYEVDVYFTAYTLNRRIGRTFLIELKEKDLEKVIIQAYLRHHLANYTYIVVNLSSEYIVDFIIRRWESLARILALSGIGVIAYRKELEEPPVLLRKAKYNNYTRIDTFAPKFMGERI